MRRLRGWESGQDILHVLERINAQPLACLDQAHDRCSGMTTFLRTGEEPIAPPQNQWLDSTLAYIVADFDEGKIEVNEQSRPAIRRFVMFHNSRKSPGRSVKRNR